MLAEALGIARNTVVHVYEQLALEGYAQAGSAAAPSSPPSGRAWSATAPALPPAQRHRLPGAAHCCHAAAGEPWARPAPVGIQWGAFTPGVPEVRTFPAKVWNRLHARLWRNATPEQLTYATGAGDAGLRESVAEYLQGTRGVVCTAEQVVITSGTQQSLYLVHATAGRPR